MNKKVMIKLSAAIIGAAVLFFFTRYFVTYDIWSAVRKGNISYVQKYLKNGGDANRTKEFAGKAVIIKGYSLLMEAAKYGNYNIASLLINNNADTNAQTTLNDTPLIYAMRVGNLEVIKLLLDHNADINWDISAQGGTSSSANTPLAQAVFYGHIDAVKLLLDRGARITNQCISLATHFNRSDIIQLLHDHGARITQDDVDFAERQNQKAIADLLKKYL